MAQKLLRFVTVDKAMPDKRPATERRHDFAEIYGEFGNCVIEKGFESVTIGSVEKFITETAFAEGWVRPPQPRRELGQSVGILGAGPAGLAAAEQLRRKGYAVHVYDRYDRVGGLLVYGIPNFKLEKHVVARRHDLLAAGGVEFHLGFTARCALATTRS